MGAPPSTTGIASFGDPLVYIPAPSFEPGSCSDFKTDNISGDTVSPGTFCGGMSINSGAALTFSPGLYIIDGGKLTINGEAAVSGTGVTFYLTGTNKPLRCSKIMPASTSTAPRL